MRPGIGQALREARLAKGVELDDAQGATKIRVRYLEALEDERWETLPGPAYVRGFLRTYASYLGLDAEDLVGAYRGEHREEEQAGPIPREMLPRKGQVQRHPRRRRHLLIGLVLVVIALIVVVAIAGGDDDSSNAGPLDPDAPKRSVSDSADPDGSEPAPATKPEDQKKKEGSKPKPEAKDPDKVEVKLRATGPVWVCLTRGGGEVLVNGETLAPDDKRGPYAGGAFEVTLGNGSVDLDIDGKPMEVPPRAEPQGYRINTDGANELDRADQPTCS